MSYSLQFNPYFGGETKHREL